MRDLTVVRRNVCKHCKRQINGKAKLLGLALICPYCGKPSEEMM
ncbi:MAG TPA: hypothetical protein VFF28_05600 [Candidatus Nanoarchaeia archaeon]|nr:hypothetical protein [Candidatus Nanoarchaeia archaeon]